MESPVSLLTSGETGTSCSQYTRPPSSVGTRPGRRTPVSPPVPIVTSVFTVKRSETPGGYDTTTSSPTPWALRLNSPLSVTVSISRFTSSLDTGRPTDTGETLIGIKSLTIKFPS